MACTIPGGLHHSTGLHLKGCLAAGSGHLQTCWVLCCEQLMLMGQEHTKKVWCTASLNRCGEQTPCWLSYLRINSCRLADLLKWL